MKHHPGQNVRNLNPEFSEIKFRETARPVGMRSGPIRPVFMVFGPKILDRTGPDPVTIFNEDKRDIKLITNY
jgi:hypothetical protein